MLRLIIVIILNFLVVSCSSITPMPTKPTVERTWNERHQVLSRINRFQLSGKIAFKSAQDSGSATLNWKENRGQYTVALFGPLGTNSIKIIGQKGNVILETANGERKKANSPESLIAQELGYQLPVSYLKYWIRGIAVPNLPNQTKLDNFHRLSQLQQGGWNVKFLSYTNVGAIDLPNRLQITSSGFQTKIIIYNWQLQ